MHREMRYQFLPNAPVDEADILVIPVSCESSVSGRHGTAGAPAAILKASEQLEYFEEDAAWSPMLHMKIAVLGTITKSRDETEQDFHGRLQHEAGALPHDGGKLLVALGGEHSITPSIVSAVLPCPGTVIHLDAHADFRDSYRGSVYNHACPAYRIREQGHRVIMAGIRSLYAGEYERIQADGSVELFRDRELATQGGWNRFLERIDALSGPVWLSIDMDVFDPSLVPGVGTPQPGGFGWYQMVELLERLFANRDLNIHGMDLVELVPDPSGVSDITAAKTMQKAISFWGISKGYDRTARDGGQSRVNYQ